VLQKILHCFQVRDFGSLPAVQTTCHTVHSSSRPDDMPYRLDARQTKASYVRTTWISVRTLICIEKLLFQLASVRTTLRDRASDFLSKSKYGKIAATVRTTCIPARTRYSLRKVRKSNSTIRTSVYHGPDAYTTDMEITCSRSTVWTAIPHGPNARSLSKKITCRGCATDRTTEPHHPDAALK
jgi:hypothetical protein